MVTDVNSFSRVEDGCVCGKVIKSKKNIVIVKGIKGVKVVVCLYEIYKNDFSGQLKWIGMGMRDKWRNETSIWVFLKMWVTRLLEEGKWEFD